MTTDEVKDYAALWRHPPKFKLPAPRDPFCDYARSFAVWTAELLDDLDATKQVELNQAMLQLTKMYFSWYMRVPQAHRNRVSPNGHTCIFHVFMSGVEQITSYEMEATPPMYFPPPPPPPAPIVKEVKVPVPVVAPFNDQGTLIGLMPENE